jgi:hypothetical protein
MKRREWRRESELGLVLPTEAWTRIMTWVDLARDEVSGLGLVDPVTCGGKVVSYRVASVHLLEQVCSVAHTELDEEAVGKLMYELAVAGEDPSRLRFWWHSHGDGQPFWSSTDERTIETFGATAEWYVSMVVNRRGHYDARVDLFGGDWRVVTPLVVEVEGDEVADVETECTDEFLAKVEEGDSLLEVPTSAWRDGCLFEGGVVVECPRCGWPAFDSLYDFCQECGLRLESDKWL